MATRNNSKSKSKSRSSSRSNGNMDAISLLKGDHKIVQDLLQKMMGSSSRPSKSLETILAKVEQEVKTHTMIEDEIFYPAFKEAARTKDDQKLFFEAKEEHHIVDIVLDEFRQTENNEALAAKCKVLKELVEHHIREEEREMFPLAKKTMDKDQLRKLAERLQERKMQIQSEMGSR